MAGRDAILPFAICRTWLRGDSSLILDGLLLLRSGQGYSLRKGAECLGALAPHQAQDARRYAIRKVAARSEEGSLASVRDWCCKIVIDECGKLRLRWSSCV
mgnify:CR=1 FL=1